MKRYWSLLFLLSMFSCHIAVQEVQKKLESSDEKPTPKTVGNKVVNGVYRKYRDDGKLFSEIPMKDGKRHGVAKDYHPNGKLHHEITYVEGQKQGVSKTFYLEGSIYMESDYVDNLLNGERKIFNPNGSISSVVPYKDNFPGKGLLEYMSNGEQKTIYPKLQIKPVDKIRMNHEYILEISFSEKGRTKPEFYIGKLKDGKYLHDELFKLRSVDRIGYLELDLPPQTYIKEEFNIIGVYYTLMGNPYIVEKKYTVDIVNRSGL